MTYWSLVLHFYQPPTQDLRITKSILTFCYLPLLRMLAAKKNYGITLNISGSLVEQLQKLESTEFFDLVRKMVEDGRVELTNSLMYHSLAPNTPAAVRIREIESNRNIIETTFGVHVSNGFFPPELAVDAGSIQSFPAKYIVVDQSAMTTHPIARYKNMFLIAMNREWTEILRSYPSQLNASAFISYVQTQARERSLVVTGGDSEIFGHHYSERLQLLADIISNKKISCIRLCDAVERFGPTASTVAKVHLSSWQNTTNLDLWTGNSLQKKYLKLAQLASNLVGENTNKKMLDLLDRGWSSCYFYWLSNFPWWHPDMVEKGARCLIHSVRRSQAENIHKRQAEDVYYSLMNDVWQYHWSEKVKDGFKKHDAVREKLLASLPKL